jgi:hypothetical protein
VFSSLLHCKLNLNETASVILKITEKQIAMKRAGRDLISVRPMIKEEKHE